MDSPPPSAPRVETAAFAFLKFDSDGKRVVGVRDDPPSSISIPLGVVEVGKDAFKGSRIKTIKLPNSVKRICDSAFRECRSLESVSLSDSLEKICDFAFCGCSSLSSITIPSSVTQICGGAFSRCSSLSSVIFLSEALNFQVEAFSECTNLKCILLPERIRSIRSDLSCGFSQSIRTAFLHYTVQFGENIKSVVGICEGFEGSVDIPEGVERTKNSAFEHSKISSIKLPRTLKYIGESAFANCNRLRSISFPDSVEFIGEKAFFGCFSLSGDISLPRQIHDIKDYSFYGCKNITSIRHSDIICCVHKNCMRVGFHKPENSIVIADTSHPSILHELGMRLSSFFSNFI